METTFSIFYCSDNIVVCVHICLDAPEHYISQASENVYNCLARYNRINKDSEMLVISITKKGLVLWTINSKSDMAKYMSNFAKLVLENNRMDSVKVVHDNFKINFYLPYKNIDVFESMKEKCSELINIVKETNLIVNRAQSFIWNIISEEKK